MKKKNHQTRGKANIAHRFLDLDRVRRDFDPAFPRLFDFDFDFDLELDRVLDDGCFLLRLFDFDLEDRGGNFSGN
jgi:hypothetical protein